MSAETYCPVYERLRASFSLKSKSCIHAAKCIKTRRDCLIIRDVRTEELASKYDSPEDIAQNTALRELEQANDPSQA
jgi:hypothetical protein